MNSRATKAALFLFGAVLVLPASIFAAQEAEYNYGAERAAATQQPKMDVDSFDGSFTYEYPLKLPPGRNGMEPGLSLIYSSKNTEQISPFGYGWSINIPYIERVNERGVNNLYSTTTNLFSSLDGELRATSTATTTEFGALNDDGSFRKYEFISQAYWKVTDKSGTQYIFGTSSLSQLVDNASSTRVFRWLLEKVQDKNGNYVKYEYQKSDNQIYPYKVKYTGHGSADGLYEIEFSRETRSDIATSSRTGFEVVSKERVKEVYVRVGSDLVKSYKLGYGVGDNGQRSILTSLVEAGRSEGGATSTMPTTTLAYSIPTNGWTYDSNWYIPPYFVNYYQFSDPPIGDQGFRLDDFNGDGLVDIMHGRGSPGGHLDLYLNRGDGSWSTTSPSGMTEFVSNLGEGLNVVVADVDGNGLSDILTGSASTSMNTNRGASFTATGSDWLADINFSGATTSSIRFDTGGRVVDLNGDGLVDLAKAYASSTVQQATDGVYLNNGAGWDATSTNAWSLPADKYFSGYYDAINSDGTDFGARFADFNGDGLTDILYSRTIWSPPYIFIYFNDGDGTWTQTVPGGDIASTTDFTANGDGGYRLADVNSDGLVDIVYTKGSAGQTVYLNTDGGRTFELSASWGALPADFVCEGGGLCAQGEDRGSRFADINGDGILDIIKHNGVANPGDGNNGSYLGNATSSTDLLVSISSTVIGNTTITYKSTAEYEDSAGNKLNPLLPINFQTVEAITRRNGIDSTISTTTYSYGGGEYYYANEFDRKFAGFATTTVTDPFGNVTKTYAHQGNGSQTAIGEYSDDRSKIGKPYRVEFYSGTSTLYKKTISRWENVSLSNGRKFALKTRELEMDYDGDTDHKDKATEYAYDSENGNLLVVTEYGEVSGSDDGSFYAGTDPLNTHSLDLETDSDQYAYVNDGSQAGLDLAGPDLTINAWVNLEDLQFPGDEYGVVAKYDTTGGQSAYLFNLVEDNGTPETDFYLVINDGADVESAIVGNGSDLADEWYMVTVKKTGTTAEFFLNGTSKGTATTNSSIQDTAAPFTIGAGNLPGISTNTLDGLIDEVGVWSRALSSGEISTLYNGGSGQTHDSMGSSLRTNLEGYWAFNNNYLDETSNNNDLTGSGSPTFSAAVPFEALATPEFDRKTVYTYVASTTAPAVSYLKSETILGGDGATSSERRLYYDNLALDSVGKGDLTKEERWATSTSYIDTEWTYNTYGLVTQEQDPRNKTTTFSYSNDLFVATTTNAAGHVTEFYRDLSSGKVKKRVDPNGLSWETTYDGLDRPTEEKIPDHLGTPTNTVTAKTYEYTDTPGARRVKETGYLNSATSTERYTYLDDLGRKIQERTEGETSYVVRDWEYDIRGQVKRESLPYFSGGSSRGSFTSDTDLIITYGYDALGRLATTTNVKGTATTSYDQWTETVTDRNGEVKRYVYDAFKNLTAVGELTATTTATTTYAYDALNNLGTTTDALGNIRVFRYDGLSRLISAEDLHATSDANYGTRFYGYDAAGNIASTSDAKGQSVEFTYDDINRVLTENYTGQSGTEIQYAYDVCVYGKGRLCSATTTEAVTNLSYDALGNAVTSTRVINNATSTTSLTYGRSQNLTSVTYPNGIQATYQYNDAGLLEQLWVQTGTTSALTMIASSTDYGPTGQATSRVLGNGLTTNYTFDDSALYRLQQILTAGAISSATTSSSTPLADNLISYWATDSSTVDSHTSANHLTNNNSTPFAAGKVDYGADFESSSSQSLQITDASQSGLDITGDLSISMWIKHESTPSSGADMHYLSRWHDPSDYSYAVALLNNSGTLQFRFLSTSNGTSATIANINAGTINAGTWYHVVWVYDAAAGSVEIFKDGSSLGTGTEPPTSIYNGAATLRIGSATDNGAYFDGMLDEVSIWDRKLTSTEVSELYNGGSGIAYSSIVATGTVAIAADAHQDFTYTYDNVGSILTITDNSTGGTGHAVSYTYDDYHRLVLASTTAASSSPYIRQYAYDAIGDITYTTDNGYYSYSTTSIGANPHAVTQIGSVPYGYDNNGNLTSIGSGAASTTYSWDWRDRLAQTAIGGTSTTTYGYDENNMRIRRTVLGNATTTLPNQYYNYTTVGTSTVPSTTTAHILLPDGRPIATVEANGTATSTYFLHLDHLGGIHTITNASGTPIETVDYFPYGNQRIASSSSSFREQRKYTGHEYDSDSDLTYARARYLSQNIGRFLSQDPVFNSVGIPVVDKTEGRNIREVLLDLHNLGKGRPPTSQMTAVQDSRRRAMVMIRDPQTLNSYSYARGNPNRYIDVSGEWLQDVLATEYYDELGTEVGRQAEKFANGNAAFDFATEHPVETGAAVAAGSGAVVVGLGSSIAVGTPAMLSIGVLNSVGTLRGIQSYIDYRATAGTASRNEAIFEGVLFAAQLAGTGQQRAALEVLSAILTILSESLNASNAAKNADS